MDDESRPVGERRTTRRGFLARSATGAAGVGLAGSAYPLLEARWLRVTRRTVEVARLPSSFRGTSVAFLSDLHHGPFVGLDYLRDAIDRTNSLRPDLVLLGGDYVSASPRYFAPVCEEMARLRAPLGRFATLGNHDVRESGPICRSELARVGLELLDNRGVHLRRGGDRLFIAGVADLWTERPDVAWALADSRDGDATVVVSHNPDYAEYSRDPRVSLMICGHTHGGQVAVPGVGAIVLPSRFGRKYSGGLVRAPAHPVFVGRGVGTSGPPVRFYCRPEIVLLTLV